MSRLTDEQIIEAYDNEVGSAYFVPEEMKIAFGRAIEQAATPQWQPIETAPKTGRTVLLGYRNQFGHWRTMRGQWFSAEAIADDWEDPECEEGWYETSVEADDIPSCWATEPTHWMPLPPPPGGAA